MTAVVWHHLRECNDFDLLHFLNLTETSAVANTLTRDIFLLRQKEARKELEQRFHAGIKERICRELGLPHDGDALADSSLEHLIRSATESDPSLFIGRAVTQTLTHFQTEAGAAIREGNFTENSRFLPWISPMLSRYCLTFLSDLACIQVISKGQRVRVNPTDLQTLEKISTLGNDDIQTLQTTLAEPLCSSLMPPCVKWGETCGRHAQALREHLDTGLKAQKGNTDILLQRLIGCDWLEDYLKAITALREEALSLAGNGRGKVRQREQVRALESLQEEYTQRRDALNVLKGSGRDPIIEVTSAGNHAIYELMGRYKTRLNPFADKLWTAILRNAPLFKPINSVRAWLTVINKNALRDEERGLSSDVLSEAVSSTMISEEGEEVDRWEFQSAPADSDDQPEAALIQMERLQAIRLFVHRCDTAWNMGVEDILCAFRQLFPRTAPFPESHYFAYFYRYHAADSPALKAMLPKGAPASAEQKLSTNLTLLRRLLAKAYVNYLPTKTGLLVAVYTAMEQGYKEWITLHPKIAAAIIQEYHRLHPEAGASGDVKRGRGRPSKDKDSEETENETQNLKSCWAILEPQLKEGSLREQDLDSAAVNAWKQEFSAIVSPDQIEEIQKGVPQ